MNTDERRASQSQSRRWDRRLTARRLALGVVAVAAAAWLLSGIYTVNSQEHGIVLRLGRVAAHTGPGIHFALPWPIDRVLTPATTDVRRIEVGFRFKGELWSGEEYRRRSDMLTGDENILKLMMVVQYKLKDPIAFLFHAEEPGWLVERAVEAAMSAALAQRSVDAVLTSAKAEIQIEAVQQAQQLLDLYDTGILLLGGNLQVVSPPEPVIPAFNDVTAAKKDSEQAIEKARTYANYVVPGAHGEASQIVQQARGQHDYRVREAEGEAQRFLRNLLEYEKAPQLTRRRLYLETIERVLARVHTVIVDERTGINILAE
jgi:membrane protease subunit HflK